MQMFLTLLFVEVLLFSDVIGTRYYEPLRKRYSIIDSFLKEDLEVHEVETEDGYFLTLHHLPGPPGSTPVFVQHGALGDSISWFIPGKQKSLPYFLLNAGYDVWIGNTRGNTYCQKHRKFTTKDDEFWNFSWHEQGYYDIPAMINYVTNLKNTSLYYIGHSLGISTFAVAATKRPEISSKVKAVIALSPGTYCYHTKSSLYLFILKHRKTVIGFFETFGIVQIFSRSFLFNFMADTVCHVWTSICVNLLALIDTTDYANLNITLIPEAYNHFPAGMSSKLFTHIIQQLVVDEFRKYDYGAAKNLEIYGADSPPNYDLSKIRVPVAMFYANNDHIIVPQDAMRFYDEIPKKMGLIQVEDEFFNHFGFVAATNAPELVYIPILKLLQQWDSSNLSNQ